MRAITMIALCLLSAMAALRPAPAIADSGVPSPAETTVFRIASFNVLGHRHTEPGGSKARWEAGPRRMNWTVRLIENEDLDVVGMQELQPPQLERFQELVGPQWTVWPGARMSTSAMHNSIAFRRSTWRLLEGRTVRIPYFRGNMLKMPYVWLEHRQTGRRIWVVNTHNPANSRGPAQRWRNRGYEIEAELINRLRADYPQSAVFSTGDKNDRGDYYCRVARRTQQHASNGGDMGGDGGCTVPKPAYVDWIMGSSDSWFTRSQALRTDLVRKASDHPLITATARLAPAKPTPAIERVVVVGVQGLTPRSLRRLGASGAPRLTAMRRDGVSTLEARTAREGTDGRSNLVGLLTGRRVWHEAGGHGVTARSTRRTVAESAGRYVSSIFDSAHNFSLGTALLSSDRATTVVQDSWNANSGGLDPFGRDDGRDKIDRFRMLANDAETMEELQRTVEGQQTQLSVAELTGPARAGRASGFDSDAHAAAVKRVDRLIGQMRARIAADGRLSGSTVVVVVGLHGGSAGTSHDDPARPGNYRVPLLVTGPGVPAGTDLYDLNPTLANPGNTRPQYTRTPPVWVMSLPALVNQALGLPRLPGAHIAYQRPTTVFSSFR